MSSKDKDPCKQFACKLQKCLRDQKTSEVMTKSWTPPKKQRQVLGKRNIFQRYPRITIFFFSTTAFLTFYSRVIYDAFFYKPLGQLPLKKIDSNRSKDA